MPHDYILQRSKRKSLTLKIKNGQVIVCAPLHLSKSIIDKFVEDHQTWIADKLSKKTINVGFNLLNDDKIYLLGKQVNLKIISSEEEKVLLNDDCLIIKGKNMNSVAKILCNYFAEIINLRVDKIQKELSIDFYVNYKFYRSRWGCCYSKKRLIILNLYCACLPSELIDAVIYHEIAHFKVANHQPEFYTEVEKICPQYKLLAVQLKNYAL
ncbi:MAG: DUF45 domain-containing protein [Erysipelotrichia bacterium]|nr:DUF45 domain-containing protein [Erysipelotrichia bacterium]